MCTLALVIPPPGGVLQVAANRDEFLARPAAPPGRWDGRPWLAPRDLQAGGTWLGLNAGGLFVGVTNRAGGPRDTDRRSRGLLVSDALEAADARTLHARLSSLRPEQYNGFHLAYADGSWAGATWGDGHHLHQEALGPGVHILTERSFGAGDDEARVEWLRSEVARRPDPGVEGWLTLLSTHAATPLESTCVHADAVGYGTRSSFVLHRAPSVGQSGCAWTEGRPCLTAAEDGTGLLRSIGRWG
jgi:hypothetical protein